MSPLYRRRRRIPTQATDSTTVAELGRALNRTDAVALRELMHPDVVTIVDSGADAGDGGEIRGAYAAVGALLRVPAGVARIADAEVASINGAPGVVLRDERGRTIATVCASRRGGLITELWIVRAAAKLSRWDRT